MTPPQASPEAGLYAKLADIVAQVGEVAKDSRNQHFNYDYTSAEAMLRALRGPLAERKVALLSSVAQVDDREYQTAGGKASVITTVRIDFTFVDGETGAMHKCSWAGRGDDNADKGLSKAYTNAIKTFLREQFLIPQGDDPEADPQTDARAADRQPLAATGHNLASDAQRRLIRARAKSAGIDSGQLSSILRLAANSDPKTFETPDQAAADVDKLLPHLPWALVDPVLERIAAAGADLEAAAA